MTIYTDEYKALLVRQYQGMPKAAAEIAMKAAIWERTYDFLRSFPVEFDIDEAYGDRLNIIGKIVGLRREESTLFELDSEYRFYLKAKIAKNVASSFMVSDEKISLQDVIQTLFEGHAYVVNRFRMNLGLVVDRTVDITKLGQINDLDLLPRPASVEYDSFVVIDPGNTFGFSNNPNSKGFASKFDTAYQGGVFARKVLI